jgi:acid phosphatase type 7
MCSFLISGDLGQTFNSLSTLQHYMESGGQTVLFVGDLSYADRYQYRDVGVRWDSWGRFIEKSAAYQPWIWCAGNHEIEYFPYMVNAKAGCLSIIQFILSLAFHHSCYGFLESLKS